MKLMRNVTTDGHGKYAVVNMKKVDEMCSPTNDQFGRYAQEIKSALEILERRGVLTYGTDGAKDEFFVLMLKDRFSKNALEAYAGSVRPHDGEMANDVLELAARAGIDSPFCKDPD